MKFKNEIIAAIVSIALNGAGLLLTHAKVESAPLFVVTYIGIFMTWLSVFLTLDHIENDNKRDLDFWYCCVVMPMMLPIALWACVVCNIYS